ncbi:hypothetical protein AB833_03750 [Chromatiales bacterium (ex Bugula neritina AB1)]|nr:hypothetical protein AB833_03750 [Chromatiales bacterium (ex Bugula neritina AB1)]
MSAKVDKSSEDLAYEIDLLKRSLSACARAVAGDETLAVSFERGRSNVEIGGTRVQDPTDGMTADELAVTRGQTDSMALWRAHHDVKIHQRTAPQEATARLVFDAVEQARVEAVGTRNLDGVASNLENCRSAHLANLNLQNGSSVLAEALGVLLRNRLSGRDISQAGKALLKSCEPQLQKVSPEWLDRLHAERNDQHSFAMEMNELLVAMELLQEVDGGDNQGEDTDQEPPGEDTPDTESDGESSAADAEDAQFEDDADQQNDDSAEASDSENETSEGDPAESPGASVEMPGDDHFAAANRYKIFTTEYDEIVKPLDICNATELGRLRERLDEHVGDLQSSVGRFANRLQRRLLAHQNRSWDFDQEEGVLDTARLTRVVTDPMQPLSFKREREAQFRDTVVTLLIDNSGSMHGRSIIVAAACADVLANTLERCGVGVEILGFTTRAWKGGQSRAQWVGKGHPVNPGRLNDLRHIVYKSADTPWRRGRANLGLMLRKGLLKENIDGEALMWAHQRLSVRPEKRKILMMISDGAPIDDSTLSANPGKFLERHLREIITQIEADSGVELTAIGIGHDVTQYYRRAATIANVTELAGAMTSQLADLFDQAAPANSRRRKPIRIA